MIKFKKQISLLVILCAVITLFPITSVERYDASEKIGNELLMEIGLSYDELISGDFTDVVDTYSCIIWIKDVEIEQAVEAGINAAELTKDNSVETTSTSSYETYNINNATIVNVNIYETSDDEYVQTYIETERAKASELYIENNNAFVFENFMARDIFVSYVSKYSPCIFAHLSIEKITDLIEKDEVVYIDYWVENTFESGSESLSSETETESDIVSDELIENACAIINADTASTAFNIRGEGVKIGQVDICCPSENGIVKNSAYNNIDDNVYIDTCRLHADNTYAIMSSVAPMADYYATGMIKTDVESSTTYSFEQNIEWLLERGVNVINMSMGYWQNETTRTYNEYNAIAQWMDHIAINHNVHFVMAAGNDSENEDSTYTVNGIWSPGMAYNIITVGSVRNDINLFRSSFSTYNNDGISVAEHRTYKPDVMAPGEFGESSKTKGTSYAAPLVTGVVALMCEYAPILKTKPFAVKAILATTALDTRNYVTTDSDFSKYGAGVIDATAAISAILKENYVESFCTSSTGIVATYTMQVSELDVSRNATKRVTLTYGNQINYVTYVEHEPNDEIETETIAVMGMTIHNSSGTQIAGLVADTDEFGANLKVVEFNAAEVGKGTYTIKVILLIKPSNERVTRYAIAWE